MLGFFLEQLESSLQGLIVRTMLLALIGRLLQVLDGSVQLLVLGLEEAVLVCEGSDLLLLGGEGFSCSRSLILDCSSSTLAADSSASRRSWFMRCSGWLVILAHVVLHGTDNLMTGRK